MRVNDCICLGDHVIYECTVVGEGATVWTGNLFQCTSGEIVLRHGEFQMDSITGECNDGRVTAHSIRTFNDSHNQFYLSQLNISVTPEINFKNITCLHVDGMMQTLVNTSIISLTRGKIN